MGASNPHPHCQIWSTASTPDIPKAEQEAQIAYGKTKNSCLLCDYYALESSSAIRTVVQNEHFLAVVPYWAVWPFETIIISTAASRRHR
jgi:UDPglucose--hexose-1-phosphate uridylyltransferase